MLSARSSVEDIVDAVRPQGLLTTSKQYTSTPHLDVYLVNGSSNRPSSPSSNTAVMTSTSNSNYMRSPILHQQVPKMSTFAPVSKNKSNVDIRYRDDPNPYKVSNIDKLRIQTQDPYKTKSTHHLNGIGSTTFYSEDTTDSCGNVVPVDSPLSSPKDRSSGMSRRSSATIRSFSSSNHYENDSLKKFYPRSEASQNSGDYEIPDPDYDGSTEGSSEELPLPPILPLRSDSSEEYSQLSISASSNSGGLTPSPVGRHDHHENKRQGPGQIPTKISETDRRRVESALKGRKTWIYVSDSLVNLYYYKRTGGTPSSRPNATHRLSQNNDWVLICRGVPVLLFDSGETRSRDKRKIQIVLAEFSSGLALWKDIIDNLSSYQIFDSNNGNVVSQDGSPRPVSSFHTMHMSTDHTVIVGLSFLDHDSADEFAVKVDTLTSDFRNISLSGAKSKSKKKDSKASDKGKPSNGKYVRPKKSDISQPCCFQHVSSLSQNDEKFFTTLQHFVSPKTNSINGSVESRSLSSNSPITSDISF